MYRPHTLAVAKPTSATAAIPVLDQVAAPVAQGHRVVMPEVLRVQNFEPNVLDLGGDASGAGQLSVREHVAVGESTREGGRLVVVAGDAVIEQQTAGAQLRLEEAEIGRVIPDADVLGQSDRRNGVESHLANVAVVGVPHFGQLREPFVGDRLCRPLRLFGRQGGTDHPDPVSRRVAHHAAPAAADVEQPVAGLQPQLLENQPVLVLLGLFQRRVGVGIHRARVRHRWAQHPSVERVGHVVVVVDGLGVTGLAVHQAVSDPAPPRRRLLRRRCHRQQTLDADRADDIGQHPRRRPLELDPVGQRLEQLVRVSGMDAVRLQVTRHVRAGKAELAGGRGQVGGPARRTKIEPQQGVPASGGAAVVRGELQRVAPSRGEDLQDLGHAEFAPRMGGDVVGFPSRGHRRCTAFA